MQGKGREVASRKVRELGDDPDKYDIQIKEEADLIRVIFIPRQKNIRGGGYEITVDKKTFQVQDVLRYQ